ncbi:MAG: hypothetical protein LBM96_06075 [Methanobrevibacter sp.]|nr:hypothetical protein [Candidatus Methanoflexus mossambicus]
MFLTIIPPQVTGVVVKPSGVKKSSYKTGWHFILPIYKVYNMDKTAQVYTCARKKVNISSKSKESQEAVQAPEIWAPTIDGMRMGFDISATWRINPEYSWWIYDNVSEQDGADKGRFYWLEENVIKAKLKSALALTVSKYNPIEVYSNKRQAIQDEVLAKMKQDISAFHLILDQIDIREVYYDEGYEKEIKQKKYEEQKVLTLAEVTKQLKEKEIQADINKKITILNAEAEAEALKIKGQAATNNPQIISLEWINKWDGTLPQVTSDGKGLILNLSK